MSNTTNYNLQTWSSSEASTDSFNNFLFGTAGDENSNMTKIDQQLKLNADNSLLSLQQPIRILNATKSSTSYYTATIANYSSYSNGNLFYLVLDNDSEDTLTLNINSYGTRSVMKIKPDGTLYNISAGDIIHGYPNLIQYDGTQWLLLDVKNLSQVGTNISGLLKGSNGQIVQATAGVDYPTVNMGLPTGGVQNDFLIKSSTTNYESEWKKIYGSNISVSESDAQTIDTALSAIGSRTGADIPVSGTDATKISAALEACVKATDIANNLTTEDSGKVLSALQGKLLNDALTLKAQYTLLYTNASPGSAFAAQTLSLDLSTYDSALVEYYVNVATMGYLPSIRVAIGRENLMAITLADGSRYTRNVSANNNGLTFGDAYLNGQTVSNSSNVPLRIFGVKGV